MEAIRFVAGRDLWTQLAKLARSAKGRRLVGVPYIGAGGATLMRLGLNDILVTSLTEANSRAGLVDPHEIARLQRRGVHVYTRPDLHAKVYFLGRRALVASANLSRRSKAFLEEAGVVVRDRMILADIRRWFASLTAQPVTPALLTACQTAYRPPRFPLSRPLRTRSARRARREFNTPPQRVWLVSFNWLKEFPKDEQAVEREGAVAARRRMGRKQGYTIISWRFPGDDRFVHLVDRGHRFIPVELVDNQPLWVWPHELVHQVRRTSTRRGAVCYVHVESPKHGRRIRWIRFVKAARNIGLRIRGRRPGIQEIRDSSVAQLALNLVGARDGR